MNKKDFELGQKADDLLGSLGKELADSRAAYADAIMDENTPNPPFFVESEPERLTVKPGKRRHLLRRAVILAAVLIVMMGMLVVTSEGVRLKLSSLFFGDAPGSTKIIDDTNLVVDVTKVEVGYVPEGFELVSDDAWDECLRDIFYVNAEGSTINICITKTSQYVGNVDNDRMEQEEVSVNDKQGHLFSSDEKYIVVWQIGDCTLSITTTLGKGETLSIANGIFLNQ